MSLNAIQRKLFMGVINEMPLATNRNTVRITLLGLPLENGQLLFRKCRLKNKPVCFLMSSLPVLAEDCGVFCASLSGLGTGMNMLAGKTSVVATWKIRHRVCSC